MLKSAITFLIFATACGVPKLTVAQPMATEHRVQSPRLAKLEQQVRSGNTAALSEFWRQVESEHTPLIEQIPGDSKHSLVTFLWRDDNRTRNVIVFSAFTTGHPCCTGHTADQLAAGEMDRLADTDVWFKTIRVPYDARFTYYLSQNDSLRPDPGRTEKDWATQKADPLNPHRFPLSHGEEGTYTPSVAEMPGAPPFPWFDERSDVPKGRLEEHSVATKILDGERHVSVYTPPGYTGQGSAYDLVVVPANGVYLHMVHGPAILDNLIAAHKIPPVVVVELNPHGQIDPGEQTEKLVVDIVGNERFNDFLVRELIPWVREHYHVTSEPSATTIGGIGFGAEVGAYAALRHPEVFGNVLAQSAAFAWDPEAPCGIAWCDPVPKLANEEDIQYEWLIRQFAVSSKLPIRFSITVGRLNGNTSTRTCPPRSRPVAI